MPRLLAALSLLLLAGCEDLLPTPEEAWGECPEAEEVQRQLDEAADGVFTASRLVELNPKFLAEAAADGSSLELPAMDVEGRETTITVPRVAELYPYADGLETVAVRDGAGSELLDLVPAPAYQLGCDGSGTCGAITLLDGPADAASRYEALLADDLVGLIAIESVASLLASLTGDGGGVEGKCAIVYNAASHAAVVIDDGADDAESEDPDPETLPADFNAVVPIVLDSDARFYDLHPDTVFARQASVLNGVNLAYAFIEPHSSGVFGITLQIRAQETWTGDAGPTTTDPYELVDEINDPAYDMVTHPADDEMGFTFIGYDVAGSTLGVAGSICNVPGADTGWGSGQKHPDNHAWSQAVDDLDGSFGASTYYGRVVVTAHELGHLFGGTHGSGAAQACAGGAFANLCGTTIMPGGGTAPPDERQLFFSDANDARILACASEVY